MKEELKERFILDTMDGIRIISKPTPQPDTVIPNSQGENNGK